jgi:putative hemolysin
MWVFLRAAQPTESRQAAGTFRTKERYMLGAIAFELGIVFLLLVANGIFAASELALVSARRSRLEAQAAAGDRRAALALKLAEQPDRLLATVQIGITLIGTFASAFGGARIGDILAVALKNVPLLADHAQTIALTIVVLIISYLSLIIGELVPKRLALLHADGVARTFAPLLIWLSALTRPLVWMLTVSSDVILTILRQTQPPDASITEDDILYMTRAGRAGGTVALHEERLIEQVFDFSDRTARMLMTPHAAVVAVQVDTLLLETARLAIEHRYSRIPVYQNDSLDHVLGTVHIKDMLPMLVEAKPQTLRDILRPPTFVLEHEPVSKLLTRFRREGIHMALVVDEYGQIAGILTLEDILEELVGDIRDEYDMDEELTIIQREDGSWLIDGAESFTTIADLLKLHGVVNSADFVTLAGFVLAQLGRLPIVGDSVEWGDYAVEVVDMDGRRVDKVLVRPKSTP